MVHIVVSRLVVGSFTIEGKLLHGDYGITVAGFDVIPPQAFTLLITLFALMPSFTLMTLGDCQNWSKWFRPRFRLE
jgi:hypothetical protein